MKMISFNDAVVELGGQREVARLIRRDPSAVSQAVSRGAAPSAWFDIIDQELNRLGYSANRSDFTFIRRDDPSSRPSEEEGQQAA